MAKAAQVIAFVNESVICSALRAAGGGDCGSELVAAERAGDGAVPPHTLWAYGSSSEIDGVKQIGLR